MSEDDLAGGRVDLATGTFYRTSGPFKLEKVRRRASLPRIQASLVSTTNLPINTEEGLREEAARDPHLIHRMPLPLGTILASPVLRRAIGRNQVEDATLAWSETARELYTPNTRTLTPLTNDLEGPVQVRLKVTLERSSPGHEVPEDDPAPVTQRYALAFSLLPLFDALLEGATPEERGLCRKVIRALTRHNLTRGHVDSLERLVERLSTVGANKRTALRHTVVDLFGDGALETEVEDLEL